MFLHRLGDTARVLTFEDDGRGAPSGDHAPERLDAAGIHVHQPRPPPWGEAPSEEALACCAPLLHVLGLGWQHVLGSGPRVWHHRLRGVGRSLGWGGREAMGAGAAMVWAPAGDRTSKRHPRGQLLAATPTCKATPSAPSPLCRHAVGQWQQGSVVVTLRRCALSARVRRRQGDPAHALQLRAGCDNAGGATCGAPTLLALGRSSDSGESYRASCRHTRAQLWPIQCEGTDLELC